MIENGLFGFRFWWSALPGKNIRRFKGFLSRLLLFF